MNLGVLQAKKKNMEFFLQKFYSTYLSNHFTWGKKKEKISYGVEDCGWFQILQSIFFSAKLNVKKKKQREMKK